MLRSAPDPNKNNKHFIDAISYRPSLSLCWPVLLQQHTGKYQIGTTENFPRLCRPTLKQIGTSFFGWNVFCFLVWRDFKRKKKKRKESRRAATTMMETNGFERVVPVETTRLNNFSAPVEIRFERLSSENGSTETTRSIRIFDTYFLKLFERKRLLLVDRISTECQCSPRWTANRKLSTCSPPSSSWTNKKNKVISRWIETEEEGKKKKNK